ncbi:MAG: hypothetical protein ACK5LN_13985 [Propioniciclava sp.]
MTNYRIRASIASTVLLTSLLVSGCEGATSEVDEQFTGPWAQQLRTAYEESRSELERQVLADGLITDAEYAELLGAFQTCIEDLGYELTWEGDDGGFSIPGEQSPSEQQIAECSATTDGEASGYYVQMRRNPENLDEAEIMVDCLIRVGVVDPSYSPEDYQQDGLSGSGPTYLDTEEFRACNADPLGTGR